MLLLVALVVGLFPATAKAADTAVFPFREWVEVTINGLGVAEYSFTPDETARYTIYSVNKYDEVHAHVENVTMGETWYYWLGEEDLYQGITVDLQAGVEYELVFQGSYGDTARFCIDKVEAASSITMQDSLAMRPADYTMISFQAYPFLSQGSDFVISSSDPNVVEVSGSQNDINLESKAAGTAVVTVTSGDVSASCTVTVREETVMELDVPIQVAKQEKYCSFTAPETGLYRIHWPVGKPVHCWTGGYSFWYDNLNSNGYVVSLEAGQTCEITLDIVEWADIESAEVTISQVRMAEDIVCLAGDTIQINPQMLKDCYLELIGGEVVERLNVSSSDASVVSVTGYNGSYFQICGEQEGEATITISASNGISKTIKVICADYADEVVASWGGIPIWGEIIHLEYTPEEDGFYFFSSTNGNDGFEIAPDSAQPLAAIEWLELPQFGTLYQLEAGKTYCWESDNWYRQEYMMYLKKMETSTYISIPETMEGKVNEVVQLEISMDGAGIVELTSSNSDVALVGDGHGRSHDIYLVGEGTAVITCTDCYGNTDTCTITVAGEATGLSFAYWAELALGAGKSVTYSFTPWESGLQWIHTSAEGEKPLATDVKLTDLNGNEIDGYEFVSYGDKGRVYNVVEDTEYLLTISSKETCRFELSATDVQEAETVEIYGDDGINGPAVVAGSNVEYQIVLYTPAITRKLVADLSVTSSDPQVAQVLSYTGDSMLVQMVGNGTADLIVSLPNGAKAVHKIVVSGCETVEAEKAFTVTLEPGERVFYEFTPAATDSYVLVTDLDQDALLNMGIKAFRDEYFDYTEWISEDENACGLVGYHMMSGDPFHFEFSHPGNVSGSVTNEFIIHRTRQASDFEIIPNVDTTAVDKIVSIKALFDSYMEMEYPVRWQVEGPAEAEVWYESGLECQLMFREPGTYTVTGTYLNTSRTCTITVQGSVRLEVDKEHKVSGEEVQLLFTAEEDGVYFISWPADADVEQQTMFSGAYSYMFEKDGRSGMVCELAAGATFEMYMTTFAGNSVPIKVTKETTATDVVINNGEPIVGLEAEQLEIPVELIGGTVAELSVSIGDHQVAYPQGGSLYPIVLDLRNEGETTLTVTSPEGINQTVEVEVKAYNDDAVAHWQGTAKAGEKVRLSYTAEKDGLYFLNHNYDTLLDFTVAADGAQPIRSFDYSDGFFGTVYKLEAGKTYYFEAYAYSEEAYNMYLKPVKESTSISLQPWSNSQGKVNGKGYLVVDMDGVGTYTAQSSNEEVVIASFYDAGTAMLYYTGEGEATVTLTDQNGNQATQKISVQGTEPMKRLYSDDVGLGSGKSVTYYFVPESDEDVYWICSEDGAAWDVAVTDEHGTALEGYVWDMLQENTFYGKVYNLKAGETYYVTYTNPGGPKMARTGFQPAQEAIDVELMNPGYLGDVDTVMQIPMKLITKYPEKNVYTVANLKVTSSNENVATVTQHGTNHPVVTLKKPGTATITATLANGKSSSVVITVKGAEQLKPGWNQVDGKWQYAPEEGDGLFYVTGWAEIGGKIYYFDENGFMQTGWLEVDGKWYYANGSGVILTGWQLIGSKTWYYFNEVGVMQTGWLQLGSTWYYLNTSGGMVTGTYVIDGVVNEFNSSGAWLGYAKAGWKQMNGNWYYLSNGGKFTTGWKLLGSTWYYFDAKGVMQTGWQVIDGADYFFHAGGGMATGWVQDGSIWYYMNSSGRKVTSDIVISGALNLFDEEGVWLGYAPAGWRQDGNNWYYLGSGGKITTGWKLLGKTWYYFNANGVMQTGWLQLGSTWYYLNTSGGMVTGTYVIDGAMNEFNSSGVWLGYSKAGWKQVNSQWYYLGNGGKVMTGWQLIGSKTWYYFNAEGVMQTGWLQLGNTKYYLTESGAMVTGTKVIDGVTYEFNSSGALIVK